MPTGFPPSQFTVDLSMHSLPKFFVRKFSKPQLNHNSTQPQRNITLVRLVTKMTLHTTPPPPPHPPTETQCEQYFNADFAIAVIFYPVVKTL